MENIAPQIKDAFDIISLILVFAFVLFDIRYPQINKELEKDLPPEERSKERARLARDLRKSLLLGALPLVVIYGLLLYLFSPLLISTIGSANFQIWRFDFTLTAFVVVYILIGVFLIWSIYLAARLINRIMEINRA